MSGDKEKKDQGVTVRVPEWLADALEDEIKSRPRPRPSRGELLALVWNAWKGKKQEHQPDEDPDVEMLRRFKEIGSAEDIKFLRGNILVFLRDAERTRRRKGG